MDANRRRTIGRAAVLVVALVALYLVAPGLLALFGSLPQLASVFPAWFAAVAVFEALAFVSIWELMRIALKTRKLFDVACAQLAGNALSRALPGGVATGGATQLQMLTRAGFDPTTTTTALTAVGLLSTISLFVLPLLALPPILFGVVLVKTELLRGAILAGVLGIFLVTGASVLLVSDRVVRGIGGAIDWAIGPIRRRRAGKSSAGTSSAGASLAEKALEARNFVRDALSEEWRRAVPAAFGNQLFDFLALQASLLAVGTHRVSPALVLLAYVAGGTLAMIPITPGGLGFVEAGLTGVLTLAGVPPDHAVLATLLYRLFSYWLPLPAGAIASVLFARRHRRPAQTAPA